MPADSRESIGARQAALVASLVRGAEPPAGFESRGRELRITAGVLERKRAEGCNLAKPKPRRARAGRFVIGTVAATILIVMVGWMSAVAMKSHPLRTHGPRTKLLGP